MKFVEFKDGTSGEIISIKHERIDAVCDHKSTDGMVEVQTSSSIFYIRGTRAGVVAKIEAAITLEIYGTDPESSVEAPGTLPTEPGFYEYRWRTAWELQLDPSPWIPVEVVWSGGILVVIDKTVSTVAPGLYTYENAEWRKRETPE